MNVEKDKMIKCPSCDRLLPLIYVKGEAMLYCKHCKNKVQISIAAKIIKDKIKEE